jgi:hypothetical protein
MATALMSLVERSLLDLDRPIFDSLGHRSVPSENTTPGSRHPPPPRATVRGAEVDPLYTSFL